MDNDSLIKTSAGTIASGSFSFVMIFFLIGITSRIEYEYALGIVVPEDPAPYVREIIQSNPHKIILDFKPNKRERNYHSIILEAGDRHGVAPGVVRAALLVG